MPSAYKRCEAQSAPTGTHIHTPSTKTTSLPAEDYKTEKWRDTTQQSLYKKAHSPHSHTHTGE
jgi:hypothetical protein